METTITKPKRRRFNRTGILVGSSNPLRYKTIQRFNVIAKYSQGIISVTYSTYSFNTK